MSKAKELAKEIADEICKELLHTNHDIERIIAAKLEPLASDAERWRRLCDESSKADVVDKSTTHFGEYSFVTTLHEPNLLSIMREARSIGVYPRKRGDQ